MRYTDDSLYPENMTPLIISAAPYGPTWLPGDAEDIAVTWDEQVQAAVDCFNAGATVLHVHVRDPETGHLSADIEHYNYMLGRLKKAVPKMIMQVGGSIAFSPEERRREGRVARLRHAPHARGAGAEAGDRHGGHRHLHDGHHANVGCR